MRESRIRTRARAALGAAAASLGVGSIAAADTLLTGSTADGIAIKLNVGEFGNATSFRVAGSDVECKHGTLSTRARTFTPLDTSDPGVFSDKSSDSFKAGAFKFKSQTKINGTESAGSWSGSFVRGTKVLRNGEKVDTCRVNTTWAAS
jgi:hypothetical protein